MSYSRIFLMIIGIFSIISSVSCNCSAEESIKIEGATVHIDCDNIGEPLQQIIDKVPEDNTITISGACSESIKIEKDRLSISGQPDVSFVLPANTNAGIAVSGRQITIKNIVISGGDRGIVVYRGGSARIINTYISNTNSIGLEVTDSSYARIMQSEIANSQRNGIVVRLSSSADIHKNKIVQNKRDGVVVDSSSADMDGNIISNNNRYGIFLHCNSKIRLGGDNTSGKSNFFSGNLRGGICCESNSTIEVRVEQQFDTTLNNYHLSGNCVLTNQILD